MLSQNQFLLMKISNEIYTPQKNIFVSQKWNKLPKLWAGVEWVTPIPCSKCHFNISFYWPQDHESTLGDMNFQKRCFCEIALCTVIGLWVAVAHAISSCLDKVTIWSQGTWVGRSKDARCAEDAGMQGIWDVHLGCRDAQMLIFREASGFWLFLVAILDFCANSFAN